MDHLELGPIALAKCLVVHLRNFNASLCISQAKSGINGLTKTVAKEWGRFNVRCNSLAYGWIGTRLVMEKEAGATIQVSLFQLFPFRINL